MTMGKAQVCLPPLHCKLRSSWRIFISSRTSSSGEYPVSAAAYASWRFCAMSFFLITVDIRAQRSPSDSFSGNVGEANRSDCNAAHVVSISSAPGALSRTGSPSSHHAPFSSTIHLRRSPSLLRRFKYVIPRLERSEGREVFGPLAMEAAEDEWWRRMERDATMDYSVQESASGASNPELMDTTCAAIRSKRLASTTFPEKQSNLSDGE
ncbi:hypothetical protein CEXT_465411 [Caerostris extrusa]|uniref:Uncharacterized protein n=1 Tax=Caerostris extrusa TaxID=172846 RepID=A0AAV4TQ96_CAEEX|nr:hypothetical protein CEXT_465411 [Caerostris extrusa]